MSQPVQPVDIELVFPLHPGALLKRVLDERQIRQSELAERTGLSTKHINQLIKENIGISGDIAVRLEKALGVAAEFWINADLKHSLYVSRQRESQRLPQYTSWAQSFDKPTAVRCGIYEGNDAPVDRVDKLLRFFNVATPEAFEVTWVQPKVSFRRSQAFEVAEHNTALWLRLVEKSAEAAPVTAPFRSGALRKAARSLRRLTALSVVDGFVAARAALAEAGVVLTFVRQVPRTRVSGATWWLAADRPVIAVTERGRKPDAFWWTLLHECGHIALHPRRETFLDLEDDEAQESGVEAEADEFARTTLLPSDAIDLIKKASSREHLLRLAADFGVGTAIVAGQYAWAMDDWASVAKLRGKITDTDIAALERAVGRWSETTAPK